MSNSQHIEIPIDHLQAWVGRRENVTGHLTADTASRLTATLGSHYDNGISAPPGLHWCAALTVSDTQTLGPDGHPETGGFLPPVPLPRRMWASSTIAFHTALTLNQEIVRRSRIAAITQKENAAGNPLVFVDITHSLLQENTVRITETQSLVYRQPAEAAPLPSGQVYSAEHETANDDKCMRITPSNTLLFRYSALTFNAHRIHYDQAYATGVEGYPDLVVQGPLMATLLMQFAASLAPKQPLATFQFRGIAPAFVNEELLLIARKGNLDTLEIRGPDGRLIMRASATL